MAKFKRNRLEGTVVIHLGRRLTPQRNSYEKAYKYQDSCRYISVTDCTFSQFSTGTILMPFRCKQMKQDLTTVLKCSQSFGLPVSSCIASFHTSACVLISLPHPSHLSVTNYQVRITHKGYISTQTHTHTYTCRLAVCRLVKSSFLLFPRSILPHFSFIIIYLFISTL